MVHSINGANGAGKVLVTDFLKSIKREPSKIFINFNYNDDDNPNVKGSKEPTQTQLDNAKTSQGAQAAANAKAIEEVENMKKASNSVLNNTSNNASKNNTFGQATNVTKVSSDGTQVDNELEEDKTTMQQNTGNEKTSSKTNDGQASNSALNNASNNASKNNTSGQATNVTKVSSDGTQVDNELEEDKTTMQQNTNNTKASKYVGSDGKYYVQLPNGEFYNISNGKRFSKLP